MARPRSTLALILVCSLPVLAGVITAFRILDVPGKSTPQRSSSKIDVRRTSSGDTCEYCGIDGDIDFGQKLHSLKVHSVPEKRSHVDAKEPKQTDDEKYQAVNVKKSFFKDEKKSVTEFQKDEGGKQTFRFKSEDGSKQDKQEKSFSGKSFHIKVQAKTSDKEVTVNDDSLDDDDDDDDDDITNDEWSKKSSPIINKPKYDDESVPLVSTIADQDDYDDDDDEDDDDDDQFDFQNKFVHVKEQSEKFSDQKSKVEVTRELGKRPKTLVYYDESDDDDDDDSDEDYSQKLKETTTSSALNKITETSSEKLKTVAKHTVEPKRKETENSQKKLHQVKNINVEKIVTDKKNEKVQPKEIPKQEISKDSVKGTRTENIRPKDTKEDKLKTQKPQIDKQDLLEKDVEKVKPLEPKKKERQKLKDDKDQKDSMGKKSVVNIEKHDKKKEEEKKNQYFKNETTNKEAKQQKPEKDGIKAKKQENILRPASEAFHRRNMLISNFEDLYSFLPTFAPNFSLIHNPECRRHGQILLRQLRGTKLWALNMLDATAKIPSGILQGNGIQLGDYDQCVSSKARVQLETGTVVRVQGKYCLAYLDIRAERPELEVPVHLAQAKNLVNSRLDDPGHFIPRFSTLSWGLCLPAACGPQDAEVVVKDALKHYQHTSGLVIRVKVDQNDCHVDNDDYWENWLELPTILTLAFYGIILLLVVIGTLRDFLNRKKSDDDEDKKTQVIDGDSKSGGEKGASGKESKKSDGAILSAFSLYRTLPDLVAPVSHRDIGCIHGLRALTSVAILLMHKFIPIAFVPMNNRLKIVETASAPGWSWFRSGWMLTDCFLLMSGTLTALSRTGDNHTALRRFFSRYLRLTPAHLAVILFYAYIWDKTSSGPLWGSLVTRNAELCQESWWWNLLYVQNYFNLEDMCAPHTHQLSLDMQLSILAGLLVWLASSRPTAAKVLILMMQAGAAYSRYSVVSEHRLTMLVYHGVSVSQLYRTARLSYISTLHRSTAYLMGVVLGLYLNKPSNINRVMSIFCWLVSISLLGAVWWAGVDSGAVTYRYSVSFAARYAALAPLALASGLALFIYAVHKGRHEHISRVLSSRPVMVISRLSYALYLCQFIIYFTKAATVRGAGEFSVMSLFDVQEISAIFLASVVLTITLVSPMQSINNYIFRPESTSVKESKREEIVKGPPIPPDIEEEKKIIEAPVTRGRSILAHREILEEIPEAEVEYEFQRENRDEGLEGIIEEEEDDDMAEEEYDHRLEDEDMEILEGEDPGGDDDYWAERHAESASRRHYVSKDDQDLDDWEWTNNNGRNGAQYWHSK